MHGAALFAVEYRWDFQAVWDALPLLGQGLVVTIQVAVVVMLFTLPLSVVVALARLAPYSLIRAGAYIYTEFFRTTPVLIQLIWFYYVIPKIFPVLRLDEFQTGVLGLTLNVTAFLSEGIRGAILSLPRGQWDAAYSTGMTAIMTLRRVILPQALRRIIPIVAAYWITLFQNTALLGFIGVQDLMFQANTIATNVYRPLEVLTVTAIIYFILTYPQALVVDRLFEKVRVRE